MIPLLASCGSHDPGYLVGTNSAIFGQSRTMLRLTAEQERPNSSHSTPLTACIRPQTNPRGVFSSGGRWFEPITAHQAGTQALCGLPLFFARPGCGQLDLKFSPTRGHRPAALGAASRARPGRALGTIWPLDPSGHVVRARQVILTVPPAALFDLDPTSALFGVAGFRDDLQAVQPQRAPRLFLAFRQPWWKSLGIQDGFSRTDLPLRQCVDFGTESEQPGGEPNNSNSLLLATFSEAEAGAFWADFLSGPSDPFPSVGVPPRLQAPRPLVEEALRQLELLHGVAIPQPYWASFKFNCHDTPNRSTTQPNFLLKP